ncbi:unnamed protein product [Mycena citricolor]|uniref:DUF2423 domain-containing protein n=1 Tax=Mycena citricolor TaxID=2018698 RepID=A0AAD2Q0N6_9AGAR|nr:unnamed protein product [Mycena citricolor]CAK5275749.1 unnamed protein product [Mycena citricolor]
MAKSTRSKIKRAYRSKKRTDSVYAVTEAARLDRLHAKLSAIVDKAAPEPEEQEGEDEEEEEMPVDGEPTTADADMQVDGESSKKVSTHGPRGSRREEWRLSKGMSARPSTKGMNRQGGVSARRKAGRSKRRR